MWLYRSKSVSVFYMYNQTLSSPLFWLLVSRHASTLLAESSLVTPWTLPRIPVFVFLCSTLPVSPFKHTLIHSLMCVSWLSYQHEVSPGGRTYLNLSPKAGHLQGCGTILSISLTHTYIHTRLQITYYYSSDSHTLWTWQCKHTWF